jgi:hypothetical protein
MTTVDQFIDQVSAMLHSYTGTLEATTYLKAAITDTDLTIPVAHPSYITRGLIEVGNELMHVDAVGETSATLFPFGRGAQNTTNIPHANNTRVTNDPIFPRQRIWDAMTRCMHNIQLELFITKTYTFTYSTVRTSYEIPADVIRVLGVQYQVVGPSAEWVNVAHWDVDHNADTATGKALILHELIQAGRTVQVVYAAELPIPETPSTNLEAIGIPDWMQSVIVYGTAWELVQFMEPARMQLKSVEARTQAAGVDVGAASNVAKQLYAMYQLRLDGARKRLLTTHPSPKHYTRY